MFRSAKVRRILVSLALLAGAIGGFSAAAAGSTGSDQATCWPTRPGCDQ